MKHLIIGNHGQLGKAFEKRFSMSNINYFGADIDDIDISNHDALSELIKVVKPEIIINCAAFNNVDKAETEPTLAFRTNAKGILNLATIAYDLKIKIVHYSSDYVFDGKKNDLYTENDKTNPINEYGKSKYAGELYLKSIIDNYLLFRLSWVFGEGNQNFIYKFLQWAQASDELEIAENEISIPTYTETIVDITIKALHEGLTGLYHLTSGGYTSRLGWAELINKTLKLSKIIIPVRKEKFNLPARRPDFSAMHNRKISQELNIVIPQWNEEVVKFLLKSY